jgi:diacylglycerol kinase family enzyme
MALRVHSTRPFQGRGFDPRGGAMYVQPIRPQVDSWFAPVNLPEPEPRVAVLLNANAKRVDEKVHRALSHVVPEGDLFLTRTFEEARAVARTVVDRRYPTVFTGGGDGTFVGFLNEIHNVLDRRRTGPLPRGRAPRFGLLKLGTGNALAGLCGASSASTEGLVDDILRARAGEVPGVLKLELLQTEGKRSPFAGVGIDAGILNHYMEIRRAAAKGPLGNLLSGFGGYAVAIAGRSIPSFLTQTNPRMEVRSRGFAQRVGPDGKPVGCALGPGALLYEGPALIAAASTVPYYGYNLKIFPFAGSRRGMFHLRIANVPIAKIIPNIYPALWNGTWFPEGMFDFLAEDVEIRLDRKAPFQIGGDAEGYRDYVRFTLWKNTVELLDFNSVPRA